MVPAFVVYQGFYEEFSFNGIIKDMIYSKIFLLLFLYLKYKLCIQKCFVNYIVNDISFWTLLKNACSYCI